MPASNIDNERIIMNYAWSGEIIADGNGVVYRKISSGGGICNVYVPYNTTINGNVRRNEYTNISVKIHGKRYHIATHRFVWMYFNKTTIQKGMVINHKDGMRCNNSIDNLECITHAENVAYKTSACKLTGIENEVIRDYNSGTMTAFQICDKYGIQPKELVGLIGYTKRNETCVSDGMKAKYR